MRSDFETATAQAILDFEKAAKRCEENELEPLLKTTAREFSDADFSAGVIGLQEMLQMLPNESLDDALVIVLNACEKGLEEFGYGRLEFVLLSLYAVDAAFDKMACV